MEPVTEQAGKRRETQRQFIAGAAALVAAGILIGWFAGGNGKQVRRFSFRIPTPAGEVSIQLGSGDKNIEASESGAAFISGAGEAMRNIDLAAACPPSRGTRSVFCTEGYTTARALNSIPRPLPGKDRLEDLPADGLKNLGTTASMGVGMALAAMNYRFGNDPALAANLRSGDVLRTLLQYTLDGWGLEAALLEPEGWSIRPCGARDTPMRTYCHWGAGRAAFFAGVPQNAALDEKDPLAAGFRFASEFAGHGLRDLKEVPKLDRWQKSAAVIKLQLERPKMPELTRFAQYYHCLVQRHIYDCALDYL